MGVVLFLACCRRATQSRELFLNFSVFAGQVSLPATSCRAPMSIYLIVELDTDLKKEKVEQQRQKTEAKKKGTVRGSNQHKHRTRHITIITIGIAPAR